MSREAPTRRPRDAEATRAAVLEAAVAEFAREGFGGGRVDRIAAAAGTTGRMPYYYFDSKEGLFRAALEHVYQQLVSAEQALALQALAPADGVRRFIEFTWGYYLAHPEFISLLNTENLYGAAHVQGSPRIQGLSFPQVGIVADLLRRGAAAGVFRADLDPVDVLLTITALAYFYQSNTPTLSHYLGRDLAAPAARDHWLAHVIRLVLGFLSPPG